MVPRTLTFMTKSKSEREKGSKLRSRICVVLARVYDAETERETCLWLGNRADRKETGADGKEGSITC